MKITNIRYWDTNQNTTTDSKTKNTSFHQDLLKNIKNFSSTSSVVGIWAGSGLFDKGNAGNLMDIDVEGIEKVWVEQLQSPSAIFNQGRTTNSVVGGSGGLGYSIDLLVRAQMVKLNLQLEQQYQREYFRNISQTHVKEKEQGSQSDNNSQLEEVLADIQLQLAQAAKQYEVTLAELTNRLSF